jgi:hypothetical protein
MVLFQDTISLQEHLHNYVNKIIVKEHMTYKGILGLI